MDGHGKTDWVKEGSWRLLLLLWWFCSWLSIHPKTIDISNQGPGREQKKKGEGGRETEHGTSQTNDDDDDDKDDDSGDSGSPSLHTLLIQSSTDNRSSWTQKLIAIDRSNNGASSSQSLYEHEA